MGETRNQREKGEVQTAHNREHEGAFGTQEGGIDLWEGLFQDHEYVLVMVAKAAANVPS